MMPPMLRWSPVFLASAVLVPACGDGTAADSGLPRCDSTVWMNVIEASPSDPSQPASLIGQCLPRSPTLDASGTPACVIMEGRHTGGTCACDPTAARSPVSSAHAGALDMAKASAQASDLALDCFCEVPFTSGAWADACRNDASADPEVAGQPVSGVCYVDTTVMPPIGNPELTKACPATEQRLLRFTGQAQPAPTQQTGPMALFMVCEADVCGDAASQ